MTFYTFLRSRSSYELRFLFAELALASFAAVASGFWLYMEKPWHALSSAAGAALLTSFAYREAKGLHKQFEEEKDLDVHER